LGCGDLKTSSGSNPDDQVGKAAEGPLIAADRCGRKVSGAG